MSILLLYCITPQFHAIKFLIKNIFAINSQRPKVLEMESHEDAKVKTSKRRSRRSRRMRNNIIVDRYRNDLFHGRFSTTESVERLEKQFSIDRFCDISSWADDLREMTNETHRSNLYTRNICSKADKYQDVKLLREAYNTALYKEYPPPTTATNKVTIVGVGSVGVACAFSILSKNVSTHVCLIDKDENKAIGEMLDLQHGSIFLNDAIITASSDYAASANSSVCVITAGATEKKGDSRFAKVQHNTELIKALVPKLLQYSPETIILMVTNPVDILTYVAWKISGLPKSRVIGSGTSLDSSRFRYYIGQKLGIAPTCCQALIIGEHGDSSVAVWSGANISGVLLRDINPQIGSSADPEHWSDLHKKVIESPNEVTELKGYTSLGIGLNVANLVYAVLANVCSVHPVSTSVKGFHGIDKDVFLSVPCVLGRSGIKQVIRQMLSLEEEQQLQNSANVVNEVQLGIEW